MGNDIIRYTDENMNTLEAYELSYPSNKRSDNNSSQPLKSKSSFKNRQVTKRVTPILLGDISNNFDDHGDRLESEMLHDLVFNNQME